MSRFDVQAPHQLPTIGEEHVVRLGHVSVRKPSLVKLAPHKPGDIELNGFTSLPVSSRIATIEHVHGIRATNSCPASLKRSTSSSSSIQSSIFDTTRQSRQVSGSTLVTEADNAFIPALKSDIPAIHLNGEPFDVPRAIARPHTWPKTNTSARAHPPSTPDHPRLKRSLAVRRSRLPPADFFALPTRLRLSTNNINAKAITTPALQLLAPALFKWRLLTFYSSFISTQLHDMLARDAMHTLSPVAHELRQLDWLGFDQALNTPRKSTMKRFCSRLNNTFSGFSTHEKTTSSSYCPSTHAKRTIHSAGKTLAGSVAPEGAVNAVLLSSLLLTSIEAFTLAIQPAKRNLTANGLAEMQHYQRLGRIVLEDTSLLAYCQQFRATTHPPAHIAGIIPLLPTIQAAVTRTQRMYFQELRYEYKPCRCGCIAGEEEVGVDGKKKQRMRYKLADNIDNDLGGDADLVTEMRAQEQARI